MGYLWADFLIRGFFERREREGFAENAEEDKEKRKPK
jgi:hypothetical protein